MKKKKTILLRLQQGLSYTLLVASFNVFLWKIVCENHSGGDNSGNCMWVFSIATVLMFFGIISTPGLTDSDITGKNRFNLVLFSILGATYMFMDFSFGLGHPDVYQRKEIIALFFAGNSRALVLVIIFLFYRWAKNNKQNSKLIAI